MSEVTVLGIFVADLSFSANKIPTTGETILGDKYNIGPGGKGCNQAIALARLGCNVNVISKIGIDDYGNLALDSLKQNKIDTSNIIITKEHQTGVAGIHVDSNTGQNAITVVRGAPASFNKDEIDINIIKKSKIFLTQLEIPIEVTLHCLKAAKENGLINILNPAPACKLDKEFFTLADYFTPNEAESEFYTGVKIKNESDAKESAKKLLALGLKKVIITLGEKGLFYSDGNEEIYIKALPFKKVEDTTGAGDAFNGGLAYALSKNKSIKECLNIANQVAGLSTLKLGAGNSMPLLTDLK